ncbi:unnamed protein product [Caenorhabditis bovis]|uniref:RUN domain-containing protein n=1 Tax=Caenorhabditis bovis TaxID=2654633 RepID=A0A8S1F116_9PELO|nr:unnamed protein product [Caenorhabditis bovis]
MVELCELQIIPDEDQWPDDIDSRIAALNFGGDSVLFESFDPSVSTDSLDSQQFRERCQVKKDDFQLAFADSGHWQSGINDNLTTWGRIRSSEPLDERIASAPDVRNKTNTTTTTIGGARPNSLIANFVSNSAEAATTRFVDVNDNEIRETDEATAAVIKMDRWRRPSMNRQSSLPKRTFADLDKTAPKLDFLAMHHEMPALCDSFTSSFRDAIVKTQKEALPSITSVHDFPLIFQEDSPDSGLGCSGPSHIEDWQSLSVLLPRHVVEACSFFKSNTQLLLSANSKCGATTPSNCIDTPRRVGISASANEACRTCYRVRRRLHPPVWAQTTQSKTVLCDCSMPADSHISFAPTTSSARHQLRARELSIVGLPIYSAKRRLVENVVEGVAAISRGESYDLLVIAMQALIEDGLIDGVTTWQMIKTVTARGPATKDVHSIVRQLDECAKSDHVKVEIFFEELIRENSLDCWLCYIVLKEKALRRIYTENAFLVSASAEYRTLLWRMVDSLSLLPVIEARGETKSMLQQHWGGASRIASDSRVPKSSSVPARLSCGQKKPSRIPLSTSRYHCRPHATNRRQTIRIATVLKAFDVANFSLSVGEQVRVLSTRSGLVRCARLTASVSRINNGICPVEHLSII